MRRVWEVLHPYSEVVDGKVTEDSFVVTMGAIWERLELGKDIQIDSRYLDPAEFYRRTHFTDAMRTILSQVTLRLTGGEAQSVYHLRVGMGGGKSHTLLLLYYLARHGEKVAPILLREGIAQVVPKARAVVIDGTRMQALFGLEYPDGTRVRTIWGLLFKQLGVYDEYAALDDWKEVPTVPLLREALSKEPTIILIDELTYYTENVRTSTVWSNKVQLFLQALTSAVKETRNSVLVVTTPMRVYEEAYKIVAPILDRFSKPLLVASGVEYKQIRRRALFQDDFQPLRQEITDIVQEYIRSYTTHLPKRTGLSGEAFGDNYPFHAFVDTTLLKLKNHQAFQEIRDELRFLAGLTYSVYKSRPSDAYVITTGHAELADRYVKDGTVAKLQDPILVTRLDDDLNRMNEITEPGIREPASRILTTIVLNSLASATPIEQGVTEEEVLYALLTPDLHPEVLRKALSECRRVLRFINQVGDRYVFGSPNLNKLMDDYLAKVERDRSLRGRWWDIIRTELDKWKTEAYKSYLKYNRDQKTSPFFAEPNIILWPNRSELIVDDRSAKLIFLDYYLPLSSVVSTDAVSPEDEAKITARLASDRAEAAQVAREFYENYGKSSRDFKNTVYFLVADRALVEKGGPIAQAKRLIAVEEMLKDRDKLEPLIGDVGIRNIEQIRSDTAKDLIPNCITVYRYLVYPSRDGLAAIELGEERMVTSNLIQTVETKLRSQARKILDRVGVEDLLSRYWPTGESRPTVQKVIDCFYRRPELELVSDIAVAEKAVGDAIEEGRIVYAEGPNIRYRQRPPRLDSNAVLIKDVEVVEVTIEAVDERNIPQEIRFLIDDREVHTTPYIKTDLKGSVHKIEPEIAGDLEFLEWDDGVKDLVRSESWGYAKTLRIKVRPKTPPQKQEVVLAISAVDIATNKSLRVDTWVDEVAYATPYRESVPKDSSHQVRVKAPDGFIFEGWSDNIKAPERALTCDVDTTLVARFQPLKVGTRLWEGKTDLGGAYELFKAQEKEQANQVRLEITTSHQTYIRSAGALTSIIKLPYRAEITASGGAKLGLSQFRVQVSGQSDKTQLINSSMTQLRDYLETVTLTMSLMLRDYQRIDEVLSMDALEALRQVQGELRYQIQILGASEGGPRRTMDLLLEDFKREE